MSRSARGEETTKEYSMGIGSGLYALRAHSGQSTNLNNPVRAQTLDRWGSGDNGDVHLGFCKVPPKIALILFFTLRFMLTRAVLSLARILQDSII
ncbi:hypothetical protein PsorP6_011805 [Peronosclerospora sorghi]|uniref:Uncharacterized protein n=1 Tax=Peronosclerospora sorghi TaxID=230839 RepID=A0ACC0WL08_9STRA|nr:hypothetical protein PsorP6_011805 [Peronosclerospora sorghi]